MVGVATQAWLPEELKAAAQALAEERQVSLSMLLRKLLERELMGAVGAEGGTIEAISRLVAVRNVALKLVAMLPKDVRTGEVGEMCAEIEQLGRG